MPSEAMKITALAPWFGGNRMNAEGPGKLLGKLAWCGVPFCAGCPELPHIQTRSGLASDLHRHVINLARCITDQIARAELIRLVDAKLFHLDELAASQRRCNEYEAGEGLFGGTLVPDGPDPKWAAEYFAAAWMGRGGHAGKGSEFTQGLAIRFTPSGGDSAKRWRSAVESLDAWAKALRGWQFCRLDVFDFLDRVKDQPDHGLYVDAPWPLAGEEYRHRFTDDQQARLAKRLSAFQHMRIVVRFGDDPLIRGLYPEPQWTWRPLTTRNQQNNEVNEVLITRGIGT